MKSVKGKVGMRVTIGMGHPWQGHSGVITKGMNTPVGFVWRVELDNGIAAGVKQEYIREA